MEHVSAATYIPACAMMMAIPMLFMRDDFPDELTPYNKTLECASSEMSLGIYSLCWSTLSCSMMGCRSFVADILENDASGVKVGLV